MARHMLVIFPGALGDLICLGPALGAIRRRYRDASFGLMARAELVRFALGRLGIDGGEPIDRREVALLFNDTNEPDRRAVQFFRRWDRIYSFFAADNPVFRRMLVQASGAMVTFHRFRPEGRGHITSVYLESIGEAAEPLRCRIGLTEDDLAAARRRRATLGLGGKRFALLFPGSGSPAKNWPIARFLALAEALADRLPVVFVLGPAESDIAAIVEGSGFPAVSGLELAEVAALSAGATVFVGNDSGVSHLAAASGAPGVVLFGPTEAERWCPLGDVTAIARARLDTLEVAEVMNVLHPVLRVQKKTALGADPTLSSG